MNWQRDDVSDIIIRQYQRGEIGRRRFLQAAGILAACGFFGAGRAQAQAERLVLATWGGATTKAIDDIFGGNFTKQYGIEIRDDGSGPSEGAIQAQVASGKVSWDVMQMDYNSSIALGRKGFLDTIDYSVVDKNKVFEGGTHEWAVSSFRNACVLCYDTRQYGDNPPKTWADFFDVEKFPGTRSIPKSMNGMPEAALLADGVPGDKLYPLDLDRAFARIKALLPHVSSVWNSGSEGQQIMLDGDASMAMLWGTRACLVDRETKQATTFTWNDGIYYQDAWGIIKGNPAGRELANKFIAVAQDPDLQVEILKLVGLAPVNPAAAAIVPAEFRKYDCSQPENVRVMHRMDMEWYADNYATALDKYTALVAG